MKPARDRPDVVVVGAGIIGLVTAWQLRARGFTVELWSRDDPAETTSATAGAIWYPFLAEPRERVLEWSRTSYTRLSELANDPRSAVRMQTVIEVFDRPAVELWWRAAVPGLEYLPVGEVPAPYVAAIRLEVPVCDVPVHLRWLVESLSQLGVSVRRREITSFDEAFAVADTVVNCSGLGAVALCGDREMQPVRGQTLVCEGVSVAHAWIDDTADRPSYVIPRGDSLVIGGTAQAGDARLGPDAADSAAILEGLARQFPELSRARVRSVQVGLRPYRSTVRLAREVVGHGKRLVHNYGHGGSGYTLAWGCAAEVVDLLGG